MIPDENREQLARDLLTLGIMKAGSKPYEWFSRMLGYNRYYECEKLADAITLPDNAAILDFGCGVADFGVFYAFRTTNRVWLNDRQEEFKPAVDHRFRALGIEKQDWREESQLPPNFFDLVIANEVLEHVPETYETFVRLAESVKPGGWLYTSNIPFREGQEYYERRGHNSLAPQSFQAIKDYLDIHFDPAIKIDPAMWIIRKHL